MAAAVRDRTATPGAIALRRELERVEALRQAMIRDIHSPQVSLPQRMRLNFRRIELESYARGIRYGLGEAEGLAAAPLDFDPRG